MVSVFVYKIDDVVGVVIADTEESAIAKVVSAYEKHGYADICADDVSVEDPLHSCKRFADEMDVIECGIVYEQ